MARRSRPIAEVLHKFGPALKKALRRVGTCPSRPLVTNTCVSQEWIRRLRPPWPIMVCKDKRINDVL